MQRAAERIVEIMSERGETEIVEVFAPFSSEVNTLLVRVKFDLLKRKKKIECETMRLIKFEGMPVLRTGHVVRGYGQAPDVVVAYDRLRIPQSFWLRRVAPVIMLEKVQFFDV